MTVHVPIAEMAELRDAGMTYRAIAERFGVSAPTVRARIVGFIPSRRYRITVPANAEAAWARHFAATAHRFNDPPTRHDVRALRRIAGWPDLASDPEGDHE